MLHASAARWRLTFSGIAASMLIPISASQAQSVARLDPQHKAAAYVGCLSEQGVTLVSAHRGGPQPGYPENALETLQSTTHYAPVMLELDVRETADGHLVLLHDDKLARTTTGSGELADHTLEQLKRLRLLDNAGTTTTFSIPTLKEVLAWADDRAIVQLDVKRGVSYQKVARAVVDADAVDSALLIAYKLEDALNALEVNKDLSFSLTVNRSEDLAALDEAGIPRDQVVAWTGVINQPAKPVWPVLEAENLPMSAGAFWHVEKRIQESGDASPYLRIAQAGVDVIASDHYRLAYDTLSTQQNINSAAAACSAR